MREKEDIISYLRRERDQEIKAIQKEAEERISAMRREAEERKRKEIEAIERWARARINDVRKTHIGIAHMEIKKRILAARRNLMDEVFFEVYRRIDTMDASEYNDFIFRILTSERMINAVDHIIRTIEMEDDTFSQGEFDEDMSETGEFEMEGDNYIVVVHPAGEKSSEAINNSFIQKIQKAYRDAGLRVTLRPGESITRRNHGAIVTIGPIEIDATLDGIMEAKRQDLEKLVGKILFSGE